MRLFVAACLAAILAVPALALAGPSIAGSFQGWNAADPDYELTQNANGVYVLTKTLPAGTHQYKVVETDDWSANFPGNNQSFTLDSEQAVTWYVNLGATVGVTEGDEYVFHSMNPPIVCGDMQSELGGVDWDPTDTSTTVMSDPDLDDVWEFQAVISPAGYYQFKIVLNNNWDQDTYPVANNYDFNSDGTTPVLFRYHMVDNTTEVFSSAPMSVVYARVPSGCPQDLADIDVGFSMDVDQATAEVPGNYTVLTGHTVVSATRDATDHSLVHLEVTPALSEGNDYQVIVSGVLDEANGQPVDPSNNDACFFLHKVVFEVNMDIYAQQNGLPASVHIQGDTYPLTWDLCGGCEAKDDGLGEDATAGDTTYTVAQYFSMAYDCGAAADTAQVKYKYVVDCSIWEGDYEFGHYVDLDPGSASQTANVWWEDNAPVDYTTCDVGVKFQVAMKSAARQELFDPASDTLVVYGSEAPLDWFWPPDVSAIMVDDGTNGDAVAGDSTYTATVLFPTGTYKFLEYKYALRNVHTHSLPNGVEFECEGYPNRNLTLDDVNGCMPTREGPMVVEDIWNWCDVVAGVQETVETRRSWGQIKAMFRTSK